MDTDNGETIAWAKDALHHYQLHLPEITFLQHSDNLTFRILDRYTGQKYLLRLHSSANDFFPVERQQPQAIVSELTWLTALAEAGLPVQPVIRSLEGEMVVCIQVPGRRKPLPCSLLGWLEGKLYDPEDPSAREQVRRLGELQARMHLQVESWQPPPDFTRLEYGPGWVEHVQNCLAPGADMGVIQPQDYMVILEVLENIRNLATSLPHTHPFWGLIHNDLHTGNWLVDGQTIHPIDFSLCGFSYFYMDIAIAASSVKRTLRQAYFDGYLPVRPLPEGWLKAVEAFAILGQLGYYAFILPRPDQYDWLYERFKRITDTLYRPYLEGTNWLFEMW
jgi:Ser/Thr protein kinase RdoA (MazF antagonist)